MAIESEIHERRLSFAQRLHEIRTGFERPFWIANISEIFERLAYYGAFASLALYLQEKLNFSTEQTGTLTGIFGGMVWFLAMFGGAAADRMGFRRALSIAYLILSVAYFLIGSIGSAWLAPARNLLPIGIFVGIILVLPALGIALVLGVAGAVNARLAVPWWIWTALAALVLAGLSRFMWFLVLFTGYWIVFWQQYISLPGYLHQYVNSSAPVETILVTDGLTVICLTLAVNFFTRKIPAFQAVILGTVITSLSWLILAFWPTVAGAVASLFVLALGEIIQSPRYYEYISRLAPPGQQGTY